MADLALIDLKRIVFDTILFYIGTMFFMCGKIMVSIVG